MEYTYTITGMHCQSCVGKVKSALEATPGITNAEVSLIPPEAKVQMVNHVPTSELNAALKTSGNYKLNEKSIASPSIPVTADSSQSLRPLFIIVSYLLGGVFLRSYISGDHSFHSLMSNLMGGFFVLFSLFKMIDLQGFADGYSTYDIIAKESRAYALAYPFIELTLGIAYFTEVFPVVTNLITLILMAIGTVGVAKALLKKQAIQCACLGTALKLPMTKVTLVEDASMGAMALFMLLISL